MACPITMRTSRPSQLNGLAFRAFGRRGVRRVLLRSPKPPEESKCGPPALGHLRACAWRARSRCGPHGRPIQWCSSIHNGKSTASAFTRSLVYHFVNDLISGRRLLRRVVSCAAPRCFVPGLYILQPFAMKCSAPSRAAMSLPRVTSISTRSSTATRSASVSGSAAL